MFFLSTPCKHVGVEVWLHLFVPSALDGGGFVSVTHRPLYPRERIPLPIEYEACLGLELVWAFWRS